MNAIRIGWSSVPKGWAAALIVLGFLLVGLADHITGTEIRAFPLYFLPLVATAWRFGRRGALIASFLASATWVVALYTAGRQFAHAYIWAINFATQGLAFFLISLLVAFLHDALRRERDLSHSDPLTGLSNSRAFFERASEVLALCHRNQLPVALAYLDLDNFKSVNDRQGHQKSDELLRETASTFLSSMRASDVVARVGGDEFVILLPDADAEAARSVLEKLRQRLEQAPSFKANAVTASIGAVAYEQAPTDLSGMTRAADAVMYRVKKLGKNRAEVEPLKLTE